MDKHMLEGLMAEIERFCRDDRDGSITIHVQRGGPQKVDTRTVRKIAKEAA